MRAFSLLALTAMICAALVAASAGASLDYAVKLQTGDMAPQASTDLAAKATGLTGKYVLIQFNQPVTMADKTRLAAQGITILDYVPNNTWIAKIERSIGQAEVASADVRWMDGIRPEQKISPVITQLGIRESAKRPNGRAQFAIIMQRDQDLTQWSAQFQTDYSAEILGTEPSVNKIDLVIPENAYLQIAQLDAVQWIEEGPPEKIEYNNSSRDNIGATTVQAAPFNLNGQGVVTAMWDGGLAKIDHPDFSGRATDLDASPVQAHATHVAGTIIGDGTLSSGLYRGMAPAASLLTQQWWSSASQAASEYTNVTGNYHAVVSNNSWGYGISPPASQSQCDNLLGNYYSEDATLDNIVRGDIAKPITIVYAAGNSRSTSSQYCGSIGWTYNTVDPLASSKNVISVGAINSDNSTMTSFSSWGPTDDGRIKPDVVGPGCQTNDDHGVTSCSITNGYTTMCGTSMAAPATTGVIALLYQQQKLNFPSTTIMPSTIRGILINTAIDLGATGPDYQYGWGKIDAIKAATKIAIGSPSYAESQISTGENQSYTLTVPGGTTDLKVTIAWDDKGGTAVSGQALINDLDLVLVDPFGTTHQVWVLDGQNPANPATLGVDHINNVETAEVTNPSPGIWTARVSGYNIPYGPQKYSIIFTPDNINTPGANRAWAVFDNGDITRNPGATSQIDFWATNLGGTSDSAHIHLSDDIGWLSGVVDTTVFLPRFDSAHLVVSATVPPAALAGQKATITCRATSKSDTTVNSQNTVAVIASAVYSVHLAPLSNDTVKSPQTLPFNAKVTNTGNAASTITVTPTNPFGWVCTPASQQATVNAHDSTTMSFSLAVPAEVADKAIDTVRIVAAGNGGSTDTTRFTAYVTNPVFPPTLLTPDTTVYSQSRTYSFTWSGTADHYTLFIATDSNITALVRTYTGLTTTSFTMPAADSLADNLYYWGVKKYVGTDSSSLQLHSRRVVVDTKKPNSISPSTPATNAIVTVKNVTFTFSAATQPGPTEAPEFTVLQLAPDSTFTTGLKTYQPIVGTSFQTPDTLAEGRWYWRIQRADLAGNVAPYSSVPRFVLDTKVPNVPTQLSPANNATVKVAPALLRWTTGTPPPYATSREYYYVMVSTQPTFSNPVYSGFLYADSLILNSPLLVQGQIYYWRVKALDSAGFYSDYSGGFAFLFQTYLCGDVNNSGGQPDLGDLSALVSYLISGQPVPPVRNAASVNCDAVIDLADLSRLVSYLLGSATLCCQ